jgi:hypothetical protein
VAIFPKFDQFVQDELQRLMEAAADKMNRSGQEIGEIDEDALEEEANIIATEKFNKYYKDVLLSMKHPPQAVVAVSGGKQNLQRTIHIIYSCASSTQRYYAKGQPTYRIDQGNDRNAQSHRHRGPTG